MSFEDNADDGKIQQISGITARENGWLSILLRLKLDKFHFRSNSSARNMTFADFHV